LLHDGEEAIDPAEMEPASLAERQPPAARRRVSEKVAHLVVRAAEPLRGCPTLEAMQRPAAPFDAAMVLLEMIIQ
jgi:hypothetical protein